MTSAQPTGAVPAPDPAHALTALLDRLPAAQPGVSAGIWVDRGASFQRLDACGDGPSAACPVDTGVMMWALDRQTTVHATGSADGRAVMAVPFLTDSCERGILLVWRDTPGPGFDLRVSRLAAALAVEAARVVDRSRWQTLSADRDRANRDRVHASRARELVLQPRPLHVPDGLQLAAISRASHSSGHFHDVFPVGRTALDVLVGEVRGGGAAPWLGAATKLEVLRTLACSSGGERPAPDELVRRVAARLTPELAVQARQAALGYARLDLAAHTVTLVDAGHGGCLVLRTGGEVIDAGEGTALGWDGEPRHAFRVIQVEAGDRLVCWTSGLPRAGNRGGHTLDRADVISCLRLRSGEDVEVQAAAVGELADDSLHELTLIVARFGPAVQ